MGKYIDADLLREKIAEQMKSLPREVGRGAGTITSKGYGMMEAFQIVRSIIDSLPHEQEELPKIAEYYYHKGVYKGLSQGRADSLKILEESMKRKADPVIVIKQQELSQINKEVMRSAEVKLKD